MNNKYMWSDMAWENYCKNEAAKLKKMGIRVSTAGVTKLVYDKVIQPNNISLTNMFKKKIRLVK